MRTAMIAITTSNSMRVNARRRMLPLLLETAASKGRYVVSHITLPRLEVTRRSGKARGAAPRPRTSQLRAHLQDGPDACGAVVVAHRMRWTAEAWTRAT